MRKRRTFYSSLLGISVRVAIGGAILALSGLAVFVAFGIINYQSYAADLVPPTEMAVNQPSAGAQIFDRNGTLLYEYVDDREGRRMPIKIDDVSPAFLAATIATEDATFFDNPGVSARGLIRAAWENFSPLTSSGGEEAFEGTGGSSITQQLVKNVYIPQDARYERSIDRKVREIVYALELTKRYDKAQIFEWYINQISYGSIFTGVESASWGYFGKPARELTLSEGALLAGIPQSPAAYDPREHPEAARERRDEVLSLMAKRQAIRIGDGVEYIPNLEEIDQARQADVAIAAEPQFPILAPHFVLTYLVPLLDQLVGHDALLHDGLRITTTIDLNYQTRATEILNKRISEFEAVSNTHNGASVVIQPDTGEILAMIGSRDYWRDDINGRVNNTLAPNSPGSTFKPFVYLASFLKLNWNSETIIDDTPVSYRETNGTVFTPVNPNKDFKGRISIRNALGNSLNIPAFKAALAVGTGGIIDYAKTVGITNLNGLYGPAISIGGVDLRALDLTYAYSVLANGGVMVGQDTFAPAKPDESAITPISILKIEDMHGNVRFDIKDHRTERRVIPYDHARMMTDILADPSAQCATFGCGGLSVPGHRVSVKTGTSEPFDPNGKNKGKIGETWAFGYTPQYVVGIWAGNSDNTAIEHIYSTSIAFQAMRDVLLAAFDRPKDAPIQ